MNSWKTEPLRVAVHQLPTTPDNLLELVPVPDEVAAWFGDDVQIVGWGNALTLEFSGARAMRDAAREWEYVMSSARVTLSGATEESELPNLKFPVAMGSFGFSDETVGYLVVPETTVVRQNNRAWVVTAKVNGKPEDPTAALDVPKEPVSVPTGLWTEPGRMTQGKWVETVQRLTRMLQSGTASKVVLARDIAVSASHPIDERYLLRELERRYQQTWIYAVKGLIGATPEMLASLRKTTVTSRVLAGTSEPGEGETLMESMKDRTEHHLAVESVARALGPLAETISVPSEPGLLDLPNVTHLATDVQATVEDANVLDIVEALHPTAAVCGTPTKLAFQILDDIEGTKRGRYSGPVGWVDGAGEGDFAIALRCGQLSRNRQHIRVFAGGGIMPDSIPELELAETRAKMKPVLEALGIES